VIRIKSIAKEQLEGKDLRHTLTADMEVPIEELNFEVLKHLTYLEPTGYGNPDAIFVARNVKVKSSRTVGAEGRHLKLSLEGSNGTIFDCIGFRIGHLKETLPPHIDVMFTLEANEWNGRINLQLNLKDIKAAGTPD
jgi:single-stranded-DNA-specific exonuclease